MFLSKQVWVAVRPGDDQTVDVPAHFLCYKQQWGDGVKKPRCVTSVKGCLLLLQGQMY